MHHDEERAQAILRSARSWLGTPYLHQASVKGVGCDCLGLIRGVWRDVVGPEPETAPAYSSAWAEVDRSEKLLSVAQRHFDEVSQNEMAAADVLVFRLRRGVAAKHVGLLSDAHHFIHAYDGNCVVESALSDFWRRRIAGVFRFPEIGGAN